MQMYASMIIFYHLFMNAVVSEKQQVNGDRGIVFFF